MEDAVKIQVFADLHIHSRYSRATSQKMSLTEIARYANIKGLNLIGTGDFTHPKWLKEILESLASEQNAGVYKVASNPASPVHFMLTTEVCTIFDVANKSKKVHHVILTPSIDVAVQINDVLRKHGDLDADGRPMLGMTAAQLVEEVIQECYQDMTKHIHALETGLSSDPPMNWRLSKLDRFALVSNSDSHSFWPWRIGREANVFELDEISYPTVVDAIRSKDPARFKFTVETDPAYGKYHWTGHRNCNVSLSPQEAIKLGNICPVCRRKLTKGVEQRVEELADRPVDFTPENVPGFKRLLPLSEIIAAVLNAGSPYTQAVWKIYNALIAKFGDEFTVLIDASKEALSEVVDAQVADAIVKVRSGSISVIPGYDGVYGKLVLKAPVSAEKLRRGSVQQMNLSDFW